jgi:hypothetical protein
MKNNNNKFGIPLVIVSALLFSACENNATGKNEYSITDDSNLSTSIQKVESPHNTGKTLPSEFIGNYHGVQPAYFMKNQYGDEMVINGNKVPVPSIDYKFLIKENNTISLQQTNLEDNSRVYYDGTYTIIFDDDQIFKIECSLSDGQSSNPTYFLSINKNDKKGICSGSNEPEFYIEKTNNNSNSHNVQSNSLHQQDQSANNESADGVYSYEDSNVKLIISISGDAWRGKTMIITGMGDEYDNQNIQYETGIVKANDLYESSGMVKIGYVNGRALITSIGGQQVTLNK